MQYIKGIENYQNERRTAITLGKFDGLHQGHELLIERVIEHQSEDEVDGVVFVFDMNQKDRLLTSHEKADRLNGRVSYFIDCPFDKNISTMQAKDFIEQVLVRRFHVKYVVVGSDFRFGYQKRGDIHMLKEYSQTYDYQLEVFDKKQHQGRDISSTYIKEAIKSGNLELADTLLGYKYSEK